MEKSKMETFTLTDLQYSDDRRGPFRLYIYRRDGLHDGGQWFRNKPKHPDEEITTGQAHNRTFAAVAKGLEVRITDSGDMLVYHARGGKVLFPNDPKAFWEGLQD
jgi:hypothetical protein